MTTPTESLVSPPAHDACDQRHETTVIVLPGRLLPPEPRVLSRRADDVAYVTMETLAAKLERVGHKSPDIQMTSEEAHLRARTMVNVTPDEEAESMRRFLRARDVYRQELSRRWTWYDRLGVVLANLWHKVWGGVVLIVATAFLTIGLCAVEVPDGIIRGLVMVETGATWKNIGEITGKWSTGDAGEISHFQLSAEALREMKVEDKAGRIARCPILAESYARRFLVICYEKRGNWPEAIATYNAWNRYRSAAARDYARRVLNLAAVL